MCSACGRRREAFAEADFPFVGRLEASDQPQHRSLTTAARPHNADSAALHNIERQPTYGDPRAESLGHALESDGSRRHQAASRCRVT